MNYDPFAVRALIVGLAREGTALARFLTSRGARVTITDRQPASELESGLAQLAGLAVELALGGHPLELLDEADILFVSPGIPPSIPLLAEARRRGLPLSSETRLFAHLCPAQIVGITGSSGKSTTTALTGQMLEAAGFETWVGGNIGRPLIDHLGEIEASHRVVMELSSFQLEYFAPWPMDQGRGPLFSAGGWSPPVSAVLNLTPNHLDRHASMEDYVAAKYHIVDHQRNGDVTVLNMDDALTRAKGETVAGLRQVLWFSMEREVEQGTFLRGQSLIQKQGGSERVICQAGDIRLLGRHNLANTLAACSLAAAVGVPVEAMRQAIDSFQGVEHRLELVRALDGIQWYNDSIATAPERTVAALQAFDGPVILLAGGQDKNLNWDEMADLTWRRVRHLVLFGEASDLVAQTMSAARDTRHSANGATQIHRAGTLDRAVKIAAQVAEPGDVVLLSPGGTSFDAYRDFAQRGVEFRRLVWDLR